MVRQSVRGCVPVVLILTVAAAARAEVTDEQVRQAIQRGAAFLASQQRPDGSWPENAAYPGGISALVVLALLNTGVEVQDPGMQRALSYLRGLSPPTMVYTASLQTMVFCTAEPEKDAPLIRRNVDWLQSVQLTSGDRKGAWSYSAGPGRGSGDNSNTQFAVLALYEAERVGVPARPEVWQNGWDYWLRTQEGDGSWGYFQGEPSTGSMTCAGIASLIMCGGTLHPGDSKVVGGAVQCCSPQTDDAALNRALQWLGAKFSAARNPSPRSLDNPNYYYYLYGVERVGRLSGRRFLGEHDWYREGAEILVGLQDGLRGLWRGSGNAENNPLIATSFALLFLSKGRRPVVVAKLKYGDGAEWDLHRSAVGNLTRRVEERWRRDLTWQTIDLAVANVEDLAQAPVLFLSGRGRLQLTREQKENLRAYINQGGFLFAEACCGGEAFDRDIRAVLKELFPESSLRLLPPEHPVWWAEEPVNSDYMRPLYGIEACCRTSVVYCPKDLSCYWELSRGKRPADYPAAVRDEVEACLRTGENVLTYATNRELKSKLDRPQLVPDATTTQRPERGVLAIPKLLHSGGGDDAPNALPNLLAFLGRQGLLRVSVENRLLSATDAGLYEYPLLFMHGRREFRFSPAERQALTNFFQRGGVLFADAICASPEFTRSFRRELESLFPGHSLGRIPPEHPLFTQASRGFDLPHVSLRSPQLRAAGDPLRANVTRTTPMLEGIAIDGRFAVIFSPYDISCALENGASLECHGYLKEDAARLAANVVLHVLQQ